MHTFRLFYIFTLVLLEITYNEFLSFNYLQFSLRAKLIYFVYIIIVTKFSLHLMDVELFEAKEDYPGREGDDSFLPL